MELHHLYIASALGEIAITGTEEVITAVLFVREKKTTAKQSEVPEVLRECARQLEQYFAGERKNFDLPLHQTGTDFQQRVWSELLKIPFGKTATYMSLAKKLLNTGAIRAVGAANGANKIAIIVPCHRIIGSDGSLTGYAGGLHRKRWLLQHETQSEALSLFPA